MTNRWLGSLVFCLCCCGAVLLPMLVMPTPAAAQAPAARARIPKTVLAPVDVAVAFPQEYQAWRNAVAQNPKRSATETKEFRAFFSLGVAAVPLMIAKMQQSPAEAYPLADAVEHITQKVFTVADWPAGKVGDLHEKANLYLSWWTAGRKDTATRFDKYYTDFKTAKKDGENLISMDEVVYDSVSTTVTTHKDSLTPFGEAYMGLKHLGIDILPYIVAQVQANDNNLIPLFTEMTGSKAPTGGKALTGGKAQNNNKNRNGVNSPTGANSQVTVSIDKRAKTLLTWWGANKDQWIIPATSR